VYTFGRFSHNYYFILKDAVQGSHLINSQATIHPFLYRENEDLEVKSFCFMGDHNDQNTVEYYAFQKMKTDYLSLEFPYIRNVTYFSNEVLPTEKCLRETQMFMPSLQDTNTNFTNQLLPNSLSKRNVLCYHYKCSTHVLPLSILYFTLGFVDGSSRGFARANKHSRQCFGEIGLTDYTYTNLAL
jgi:hypothetical protein